MYATTRTYHFNAAAAAAQTLPEKAVAVLKIQVIAGSGTALTTDTNYGIVPSGATGSQADFAGSVETPTDALTFASALTADDAIAVTLVPVGAL